MSLVSQEALIEPSKTNGFMRKVKEDNENLEHELASYGSVNPFLVILEIVGQNLKETLIKGTEKNEIKCNIGLLKAVCARPC